MSREAGKERTDDIQQRLQKARHYLSDLAEKELFAENPGEAARCRREIRRVEQIEAKLEAELEEISQRRSYLGNDEVYEHLCRLNFTHQTKYFESLLESKKVFLSFVIRGPEADYGQEWLTSKLIHSVQKSRSIHKPISIDFAELNIDLNAFIEQIGQNLGVKDKVNKNRPKEIRRALEDRIATKSQFVIIKNAHHFIHNSEEFYDFINVIEYFHEEMVETSKNHKCVFIFVEMKSHAPYSHKQYCTFSNETTPHLARKCKGFRFIDLDAIQPIVKEDLEDWLESLPEETSDIFEEILSNQEQMENFIADGNPQRLIPLICEKLGKKYAEYESKWRKQ